MLKNPTKTSGEKVARVHSHVSNRDKAREAAGRKTVYKSVLDNPFQIQWPSVPLNVQNSILAHSLDILDGVSAFHLHRDLATRKRKKSKHVATGDAVPSDSQPRKRAKIDAANAATSLTDGQKDVGSPAASSGSVHEDIAHSVPPSDIAGSAPPILKHLVIGINEVTKRLELQAKSNRQSVTVLPYTDDKFPAHSTADLPNQIRVVLVCCADVDPPLLIAHLPHLVAACNSSLGPHNSSETSDSHTQHPVKLIPLPKGAEFSLAEALGLRRVAVLGIINTASTLTTLVPFLDSVPTLSAPWLVPISSTFVHHKMLEPTHIKQLRTSAPKDMRVAKEQRSKERKAAKARRKERAKVATAKKGSGIQIKNT